MSEFEEWLYRVSGSTSQRSIAAEVGYQNTALSRWIREKKVPAEKVIEIARHFNANIWDGLTAAGFVSADDMSTGGAGSMEEATNRELLEELLRRVEEAEAERMPPPHLFP